VARALSREEALGPAAAAEEEVLAETEVSGEILVVGQAAVAVAHRRMAGPLGSMLPCGGEALVVFRTAETGATRWWPGSAIKRGPGSPDRGAAVAAVVAGRYTAFRRGTRGAEMAGSVAVVGVAVEAILSSCPTRSRTKAAMVDSVVGGAEAIAAAAAAPPSSEEVLAAVEASMAPEQAEEARALAAPSSMRGAL
jgi:hypothetical protein